MERIHHALELGLETRQAQQAEEASGAVEGVGCSGARPGGPRRSAATPRINAATCGWWSVPEATPRAPIARQQQRGKAREAVEQDRRQRGIVPLRQLVDEIAPHDVAADQRLGGNRLKKAPWKYTRVSRQSGTRIPSARSRHRHRTVLMM